MCSFKTDDDGADNENELNGDRCVPIRIDIELANRGTMFSRFRQREKNLLAWVRIVITGRQV